MKQSTGLGLSAVAIAGSVGAFLIWGRGENPAPISTTHVNAAVSESTPALVEPDRAIVAAARIAQPAERPLDAVQPVQAGEQDDGTVAPPPEMLNREGLATVLQLVNEGVRIQDSPEYQRFLDQAAAAPQEALGLLRRELEAAPASDIALRSRLFGVMSEITLAIAGTGAPTDSFVQGAWGLIEQQVHSAPKVAAAMQSMTYEQTQELTHLGPYSLENGRLYAHTFQPKFMAVAVLKDSHSDAGRRYLSQIANNPQVDPLIRRVAALHASEQGSMQRY